MNEPSNKTKKESLQKSVISVMRTRWRKKVPQKTYTAFTEDLYPDPPGSDLTLVEYFQMFFDKDLVNVLSQQTTLYSVQVNVKSINTNNKEIEQYLGVLIFTGVLKFPQYRLYWNPSTRIPTIADAMVVNC